MSHATCDRCEEGFDAARLACCPVCLVALWLDAPELVRPKHDPRLLPLAWPSYRSVLSPGFVAQPRPTLEYAARHGRWYWDTHYDMYVHLTFEPLGLAGGSGIPEGAKMPEHALDSLLIVEADSRTEAHAFAVERTQFEAQIRAGEFEPLARCDEAACENLRRPRTDRCTLHAHSRASGRETREENGRT